MANRAAIASLLVLTLVSSSFAQLQPSFYAGKCGANDVESIIRGFVQTRFSYDPDITAFLLRLLFHDCFGNKRCDGSLLLRHANSEQTAVPNFTVKAYDLIDFIKDQLEAACPGVVSCSDIIAAATRDAIKLAGGIYFDIPLGRRDGTQGQASDVDLPSPDMSVASAVAYYEQQGFSAFETVVLLGGHTVGVTHCNVIKDRLFNFKGTGQPDPALDAFYIFFLGNIICQDNPSTDDMFVFLDSPDSVRTVDNRYYQNVLEGKGILAIDDALGRDPITAPIVQSLAANNDYFLDEFAKVIVKMSELGVLTGNDGEIRTVCWKTNN